MTTLKKKKAIPDMPSLPKVGIGGSSSPIYTKPSGGSASSTPIKTTKKKLGRK